MMVCGRALRVVCRYIGRTRQRASRSDHLMSLPLSSCTFCLSACSCFCIRGTTREVDVSQQSNAGESHARLLSKQKHGHTWAVRLSISKGEGECDYVTLIAGSVLLGCYCVGIVGGQ